jgi:hypothetical protein
VFVLRKFPRGGNWAGEAANEGVRLRWRVAPTPVAAAL